MRTIADHMSPDTLPNRDNTRSGGVLIIPGKCLTHTQLSQALQPYRTPPPPLVGVVGEGDGQVTHLPDNIQADADHGDGCMRHTFMRIMRRGLGQT